MVTFTGDPYRDYDLHDADMQAKVDKLPICDCCREPIQGEDLYDFDGDLICEDCMPDYVKQLYRKKTEDYMED